ncbi:MAG: sigma-70 family RNA polymerase sigma factor [Planctomycetes bacterium]|nr:sigma-70 family RNA polymerase sigma factor [Planctomycetota bacterium]
MPPHARALLCRLRKLTSPSASDAALLARWRDQRDETAFADLVARHGPMVLGVCRRVLGDVQLAEDTFQATFLVLARKAADLRRPESLPGFLYSVALRLAQKARGAARRTVQPHPEAPEPADPHPDPLDALSGRELLTLLDEEINRLPEVYRLPLLLCALQERPAEEAARVLGWSVGSVRGRLARARQRLRERLARRGLDLSVGMVALLVPAVVPERLLAGTLRRLAAPVSPAVESALGAGAAPALRLRAACLVLLMAAGLGAGLSFLRTSGAEPPSAATPVAPAPGKGEPRRDRAGDPLPPGAIARLGTLRFRAPDTIEALAFAPDGKTVAASTRAGVYLFDAVSGKRTQRLLTTGSPWWGSETLLVFSPDSKRLVGRGKLTDNRRWWGVVRVWNLAGGKLHDHDVDNVVWVGWSSGGEPLAVCLEAGALRLRELSSGRSRRFACSDPGKPVLSDIVRCVCSPEGQSLAFADKLRIVHVWDIATGRERCTIKPRDYIRCLALSSDGRRLASLTREEHVELWDAQTGKALHTLNNDQKNLTRVVFTADGKTLATVGRLDVRFWDVTTGRERGRAQAKGRSFAESVAFSPDGKTLASSEDFSSTTIDLWDVAKGRLKPQPVGHWTRPYGTVSPDSRRVATGGGVDGTVRLWDLETGDSRVLIQRPERVRGIAFSPDGRLLYSTGADDEVWVSDAITGERRHVIKLEDPERPDTYQSAIAMHLFDDGKTLVAFSYYHPKHNQSGQRYEDTLITGWDTATRKQLFRRRYPGTEYRNAVSADGRVLALPHWGREPQLQMMVAGLGPMRLEDLATGERLLTFPALERQTCPLTFSPDGRLLASSNWNFKPIPERTHPLDQAQYTLRLWETATAAELLVLPAVLNNRAAFSADGRLLAMAAPSQEILLWDLASGREHRRFKGFDAEVTWLAFSPDGRRLVSGLSDSTLLVWDVGPRGTTPGTKLGGEGLAKAWADLAGADAPRAFRARWMLASSPEETVGLLKGHLRRAEAADPQQFRRLLADLESGRFAVRAKAQAELEELGDLAVPALRQALANKPSLEMRQRVQAVLDRLREPLARPEVLRPLRAVAVLEDIGTPSARKLLEGLASGAPEARLTREAKASLGRLGRRIPAPR